MNKRRTDTRAEAKGQGAREYPQGPLGPLRSSEEEEGARVPKIRAGQEYWEEEKQATQDPS